MRLYSTAVERVSISSDFFVCLSAGDRFIVTINICPTRPARDNMSIQP
ncbi:MAG: hypothetical protein LBP59_04310 [Planctomycetaceae bacterium]|nr:hypothetical protein [Planctomycetaceae bacterium]